MMIVWKLLNLAYLKVKKKKAIHTYIPTLVEICGFQNDIVAFMAVFLVYLQLFFFSEYCAQIIIRFANDIASLMNYQPIFPTKLDTLRGAVGFDYTYKGMFRLVVCSECHTLYKPEEVHCESRCTFFEFNTACNTRLFKTIGAGATKMYANKVSAFNSIKYALKVMFSRPGFELAIEAWRDRTCYPGTMFDMYDGRLWNEFKDKDGNVFTSQKRSLMLTLNVDWFQSSKRTNYSVGVVYLTIGNLPRPIRYKKENVILVCVIPGPKEPSNSQMNNYLQVLVNELRELYYEDFYTCTAQSPNFPVLVRAALILIACDIPASRKVSGFTSFNATVPCNKCSTAFPPREDTHLQRDFSFGLGNPNALNLHTDTENRIQAENWKRASTKKERASLERKYGTRFSALHGLDYLDLVRSTAVDPMHNLFLGTAKKMVEIWCNTIYEPTGELYLTNADLKDMQKEAGDIIMPAQCQPIGRKIANKFSDMKADEWKTWCLVLSPILLKGRLPISHKENWATFVQACHIVCRPSISVNEASMAHQLYKEFCLGVVRLYGQDFVTPNMHLHLHLMDSILDFGPIYSFWLYGFERMNGDIKKMTVNFKTAFEVTYMKKFLSVVHYADYIQNLPSNMKKNQLMSSFDYLSPSSSNTLVSQLSASVDFDFNFFASAPLNLNKTFTGSEVLPYSTKASIRSRVGSDKLDKTDYGYLLLFYKAVYPDRKLTSAFSTNEYDQLATMVIPDVSFFPEINVLGQVYRSKLSRSARGCYIEVAFNSAVPGQEPEMRIGEVQYFFQNVLQMKKSILPNGQVFVPNTFEVHTFAFVRWYNPPLHPFQGFEKLGAAYYHNSFRSAGQDCILPICRIYTCVAMKKGYPDNHVVFLPLPRKTIDL